MKRGTDRAMRRWRAATLLALGAVIGMVMVATPAGAHVGGTVNHLWGHIKPKADQRYLPSSGNLKPGKTLRGVFWAIGDDESGGGDNIAAGQISFQVPLSAAPTAHFIGMGDPVPAGCSGTAAEPGASPGHLCVFQASGYNSEDDVVATPTDSTGATRHGAILLTFSSALGRFSSAGTWAVTAPAPTTAAGATRSQQDVSRRH